jgi:hypothetical protein
LFLLISLSMSFSNAVLLWIPNFDTVEAINHIQPID